MALFLDPAPSPYRSASLKVVKSAGLNQDAGTPVLDVEPPETQILQATVGNDRADITGVRVQFWAMAFGTGTTPFLSSVGGGQGKVVPAGGSGETVVAGTPRTFDMPWDKAHDLSSTDPQIAGLFAGVDHVHCCIMANVWSEGVDGARIVTTMGPTLDLANPHHAQRNMTIVTHAGGVALRFLMFAGNTDPKAEQEVLLAVAEPALRKLARAELEELDALAPWIRRSRKSFEGNVVRGLEVALGEQRLPIRLAQHPLEDLELESGDERGSKLTLRLRPDDPQRVWLRASLPEEELVLRALDVAQTERGEIVGRARVLLLTVPKELLDERRANGEPRI